MKTARMTILSLVAFAFAGHAQTNGMEKAEPKADDVRRLESVTWDLKTHTLKWTVQKGTEVKGEFQTASTEHYEISPDSAMMKVADEKRALDQDEAALLHRLLDTISIYCAESVVWWDHGEGARITDDADRTSEDPAAAKPAAPPKRDAKPAAKPDAKPSDVKPKALPLGVAEVAAHPAR
jgi:hypothetical protein